MTKYPNRARIKTLLKAKKNRRLAERRKEYDLNLLHAVEFGFEFKNKKAEKSFYKRISKKKLIN